MKILSVQSLPTTTTPPCWLVGGEKDGGAASWTIEVSECDFAVFAEGGRRLSMRKGCDVLRAVFAHLAGEG